jgi:hypothetical protein
MPLEGFAGDNMVKGLSDKLRIAVEMCALAGILCLPVAGASWAYNKFEDVGEGYAVRDIDGQR